MKCGDCRYFTSKLSSLSALKAKEGVGECRRNAPRGPVTIGWSAGKPDDFHNAIMSAFPFVPEDDWCGEFSPAQK